MSDRDHVDGGQLSRLIDGDLSLTSREAVTAHLRECPGCAQRHDELVAVAASLRLLPAVQWTASDTERLLGVLERHDHPARRLSIPLAACLAVCLAAVIAAASVIMTGFALGEALVAFVGALSPVPALASATPLLWLITAVAVLAPLAAYPLARWR